MRLEGSEKFAEWKSRLSQVREDGLYVGYSIMVLMLSFDKPEEVFSLLLLFLVGTRTRTRSVQSPVYRCADNKRLSYWLYYSSATYIKIAYLF